MIDKQSLYRLQTSIDKEESEILSRIINKMPSVVIPEVQYDKQYLYDICIPLSKTQNMTYLLMGAELYLDLGRLEEAAAWLYAAAQSLPK